jgi:hypothetical protein
MIEPQLTLRPLKDIEPLLAFTLESFLDWPRGRAAAEGL